MGGPRIGPRRRGHRLEVPMNTDQQSAADLLENGEMLLWRVSLCRGRRPGSFGESRARISMQLSREAMR